MKRLSDTQDAAPLDEALAKRILDAVTSLRYGTVEITIHDGRIVQIDRRERTRIEYPRP